MSAVDPKRTLTVRSLPAAVVLEAQLHPTVNTANFVIEGDLIRLVQFSSYFR
jgi:hypothetical protein